MANRTFNHKRNYGVEHVSLEFTFAPQGAGAPLVGEGTTACVASVVRTSAGVFTITLTDSFLALVSANATIQMAAATDLVPQWGAIDVVTAKTLVLRTNAVATPTDIAANAANQIFVSLTLRNSSVKP